LIVLQHAIRIAREQDLNVVNAGALAILHDLGPVEKIRKADVELAPDPQEKAVLEQKRRQNRILHMREGSALAQRKLLTCNEYLGRPFFTDDDIEEICEVIRIHDNPSIDVPIPRGNRMAVSFREADRLWMLSERGFAYDLLRDMEASQENADRPALAAARLSHVTRRYQQERHLYPPAEGPFPDNSVFFRTKAGHELYLQYAAERRRQYGLP
jgi:hypothetical protein